jgi:hypothetical protein
MHKTAFDLCKNVRPPQTFYLDYSKSLQLGPTPTSTNKGTASA